MDNLTQEIIDRMADEAHDLYIYDDEGKYEFNEIIEQFGDNVKTELEKNGDLICHIVEYDEDFDTPLQEIDDIMEDLKGHTIVDYYTAKISDIHFWFVLLKKKEQ